MMEIKTPNRESAREDEVNTIMKTEEQTRIIALEEHVVKLTAAVVAQQKSTEQQRIALLEGQVNDLKRAITLMEQRLRTTTKKTAATGHAVHRNTLNLKQISEQLNQ